MRLIDADALWEEVDFHVTSVSVCATSEQAIGQTEFKNRCLEDIDNAPTIDAIPVEWLNDKMLNGPRELSMAAWRVLNAWHPRDEGGQNEDHP